MYGTGGYAHFPYAGQTSAAGTPVNVPITQAAGIGVAGSLTPNLAGIIIGVAGVGVARATAQETVSDTLQPVAGIGVARGITPNVLTLFSQVAGIGVAGILSNSEQAFLLGVSGGGAAGIVTTSSTALTITQANAIGVAGTIGGAVAGFFAGVAGTGIAGRIDVVISGGGGNWKRSTGLEPVKKRPRAPPTYVEPRLPLPPFRRSPALAPADLEPIELVDHKPLPGSFLELEAKIHSAEDISDVQMFLAHLEQDEQDAADIADVLAMLDED